MSCLLQLTFTAMVTTAFAALANAADKPIKTFILAGQSNMVGWGDSTKLPDDLRNGNDRVLMFEDGKWQPLRPHGPANQGQRRVGLAEFHFGPEIPFGYEMAKAWPHETIGIIKFSIGGTSVLAWKPDWSREDADRVGQGRHGSLYRKLMAKVDEAGKARDIEIVGFLWLQGGSDTKNVDVAREYLDNLKSVVAAVRKGSGVADLPFIYGTTRIEGFPDDLADFEEPKNLPPGRPGAWLVLKAQFDAQKAIPNSKMVILRATEKHPANVHYNTAGQLVVGKLFAEAFLEDSQLGVRPAPPNCPACAMGLTAEFVFKRLDVDDNKVVTVKELSARPCMQDESAALRMNSSAAAVCPKRSPKPCSTSSTRMAAASLLFLNIYGYGDAGREAKIVTSSECSPWTRCCRIDGLTVTNEFDHKLEPENSPQPESVSQPQSDRITRRILTAIGIYTGLLVTLLNVFLLDMNACIEGCFAAGATEVVIRDHHGRGRNVNPQSIDKRAKLIQGKTLGSRFNDIEGSAAMILLGYHAKVLTPGGTLAHSFSSASIQGMWLNGREAGEIGVDAAITAVDSDD